MGRRKQLDAPTELDNLIISALRGGNSLIGKDGVLTPFIQRAVQSALEGEMEAHLEETRLDEENRRNGYTRKQVKSGLGTFDLQTPRDRAGSFEPQLVQKRQTVLTSTLDENILQLFSAGMSYSDIHTHMRELYGAEVSDRTINAVTDKLLPDITQWQSRPLDAVYPIIFLDAMHFKVRGDTEFGTKAMYNIMGINCDGQKEILGFYIGESEGAKFWLSVLSDLKARGVQDILISCIDGLKGFPEAIATVFPKSQTQLCIVHQIRNSLKYVSSKDQKAFLADLRPIYQAPSKDVAEQKLLELDEKWGKKYTIVLNSWNENWDNLSTYFVYPPEVRRLIYTTNPIEGFHRQVRKYTKSKGAFTSENALKKLVFCAITAINKRWNDRPIQNWALIISQLDITFPNRMKLMQKKH